MGYGFFGGEIGIRTLDAVSVHTRFPVVRLRPTQPSLHAQEGVYHISFQMSSLFAKFFADFFVSFLSKSLAFAQKIWYNY